MIFSKEVLLHSNWRSINLKTSFCNRELWGVIIWVSPFLLRSLSGAVRRQILPDCTTQRITLEIQGQTRQSRSKVSHHENLFMCSTPNIQEAVTAVITMQEWMGSHMTQWSNCIVLTMLCRVSTLKNWSLLIWQQTAASAAWFHILSFVSGFSGFFSVSDPVPTTGPCWNLQNQNYSQLNSLIQLTYVAAEIPCSYSAQTFCFYAECSFGVPTTMLHIPQEIASKCYLPVFAFFSRLELSTPPCATRFHPYHWGISPRK